MYRRIARPPRDLRETYGLLQDDASAARALVLELTIVVLIAVEIVLALLKA